MAPAQLSKVVRVETASSAVDLEQDPQICEVRDPKTERV